MSSLPHKVLIVLFLISRWQFLPSNSTPEGLLMPIHHGLEVEAASPWLQIKRDKCFLLKSSVIPSMRHSNQSKALAASNQTMLFYNILTSTASRDSAPRCTWTGHPLGSRKYRKLKNAALKENYTHNGAIECGLERSITQRCCGRTFKKPADECLKSWWRVRLKQEAPGQFHCCSTLMLNVYIAPECLSELKARDSRVDLSKAGNIHWSSSRFSLVLYCICKRCLTLI